MFIRLFSRFALAMAAFSLCMPAIASNNYAVKDGNNNPITKCSRQQSDSSQADCSTDIDSTGAEVNDTTLHAKKVISTDAIATGTIASGTLNAAFTANLGNGAGTVAFAVSGLTASGAVLTVEATNDGTTWTTAPSVAAATGAIYSTLSADGQYRVPAAGRRGVRLKVTNAGTGTIMVSSNASTATHEMAIDPNNAAYQGVVPMTVGTTYPAQRGVGAYCTAASSATMTLTLSDGSTIALPLSVGWQQFSFAATAVASTVGTLTCTFYNLK